MQPAPLAKYVIVVMPLAIPVTIPDPGFTVAMPVLLLVQVPVPKASVKTRVAPGQIGVLPVTADGIPITVTAVVATQPVLTVYVMVVVPNASALTAPEGLIVGTEVLLLVHDIPPEVTSERNVIAPTQTVVFPSIAPGSGLTFIVRVV